MRPDTLDKLKQAVILYAPDAPELLVELLRALDQLEKGLERFCSEETCTRAQGHEGRCGKHMAAIPPHPQCNRRRVDCGDWTPHPGRKP